MDYVSLFIISFTIALSGALMPGPLLTTVIAESARHGTKTGPLICVGHAILEAGMIGLIVAGFARFIHNPTALFAVSLAGSGILLYFGSSMLLSVPGLSIRQTQKSRTRSVEPLNLKAEAPSFSKKYPSHTFIPGLKPWEFLRGGSNLILLGVTVSISNPYWTVWWLTIGLGLVLAAQKQGFLAVAVFFLGHIFADFSWYSIVSLGIAKGRKFLSDRIYKGILVICALSLIGFGIYFLTAFMRSPSA